MKNFIQKTPFISFLLAALGLVALVFGVYGIINQSSVKSEFSDIVQLDSTELKDENEGKVVALYAPLEVKTAPTEKATKLTVDCAVLYKEYSMYQYYIQNDVVIKDFLNYSCPNITGQGGESYENPEFPEKYKSEAILADLVVKGTDIKIGQGIVESLISTDFSKEDSLFRQYNPDITIKGFTKDDEGTFTNSETKAKIGDIQIMYYTLSTESLGDVLIVGKQENGSIVYTDREYCGIYTNCENLSELEAIATRSEKISMIMAAVGAVFTAAGVAVAIVMLKRRENNG